MSRLRQVKAGMGMRAGQLNYVKRTPTPAPTNLTSPSGTSEEWKPQSIPPPTRRRSLLTSLHSANPHFNYLPSDATNDPYDDLQAASRARQLYLHYRPATRYISHSPCTRPPCGDAGATLDVALAILFRDRATLPSHPDAISNWATCDRATDLAETQTH